MDGRRRVDPTTEGPAPGPEHDGRGADEQRPEACTSAVDDDEPDPLAEMLRAIFGEGGPGGRPASTPSSSAAMLPPGLANMPGMPRDPAGLQAMFAQVQQHDGLWPAATAR